MAKPIGTSLLTKITGNKDHYAVKFIYKNHSPHASGFTLIELVMIILLLSILSVTAIMKWPSGMDTEAAALEFKRAVRYAQHIAMSREFTTAAAAWGLSVTSNKYTIQRRDGTEPVPDFSDRYLLGDSNMTIVPGIGLWFNGLGEPIDNAGVPLSAAVTYIVAGTENMTICPQTGYLIRGATCP